MARIEKSIRRHEFAECFVELAGRCVFLTRRYWMVQKLMGVGKVSQEVHLEVAPQNFASSLQAIAYSARAWLFFPTR